MKRLLLTVVAVFAAAPLTAAEPTLDGTSVQLWKPCTGWVKNAPSRYQVSSENGTLVFRAEGAGTEMPWIADLKDTGVTGDERYLLVRYRATGMSTNPNVYFLHGEEGSHGGRNYAGADVLKPDGDWHTLSVPLVANPNWKGMVNEIWFDPVNLNMAYVDIAWMRFE